MFHISASSADYLRNAWSNIAVDVIGRRLFDLTNGWSGVPAVGDAVFVVTHQPPTDWPYPNAPFTFVPDGVPAAVAQAQTLAGDRDVSINAGNLAGQAFEAGLIDEVRIDLVPVVLGRRHPVLRRLQPVRAAARRPEIVPGDRVTHLIIESGSDDHAAIGGLPIALWSRVMHEKAGWAS